MHPLSKSKQSIEHIRKRVEARRESGSYVVSEKTKVKIRIARSKQIITEETKIKMSLGQKRVGNKPPHLFGKKHPGWKGEKVKYRALHSWIERRLGTPKCCANCSTTSSKRFSWANISHTYKRDLSDWIRLCGSCHSKYDRYGMKLEVLQGMGM